MTRSFSRILRDRVCDMDAKLRIFLGFCVVVFSLLLVSLTVVERGTATYIIVVVDLVSVAVIGVVVGAVLLACRR